MREIHRNPILYYLLIPALIGVWPLLVWAVYLPKARQACGDDYALLIEAQTHIMRVLELDPDRLKIEEASRMPGEFVYGKAFENAANLCGIPSKNYPTSVGDKFKVSGKLRQNAGVKLKDISIVQAAKFLSIMQSNYVGLQCDKIKLTKRKGMPDQWEADLDFIYYH